MERHRATPKVLALRAWLLDEMARDPLGGAARRARRTVRRSAARIDDLGAAVGDESVQHVHSAIATAPDNHTPVGGNGDGSDIPSEEPRPVDAPPHRITNAGRGWARTSVDAPIFRKDSLTSDGTHQYLAWYDDELFILPRISSSSAMSGRPGATRVPDRIS